MFALERLRALLDNGDLDHDGLKGTANEQTSGHEKAQYKQPRSSTESTLHPPPSARI